MALRQRRRLRYLTAREKIATGSLVCGFVAFAAAYLGLEGVGFEGNFASIPAAILGIALGLVFGLEHGPPGRCICESQKQSQNDMRSKG